jgi:hypothetical protein
MWTHCGATWKFLIVLDFLYKEEEHRDRQRLSLSCSVLLLSAMVNAKDAQFRSAAHRVLSEAPLLLEQYHKIIRVLL